MNKESGLSMMELFVSIIIMGVLATLSIHYLTSSKENVADREAASNLKTIQIAEKAYHMDKSTYYPAAGSDNNLGTINTNLKLSLSTEAGRNWDYEVFSTGCAQATRTDAGARQWFLAITDGTAAATDGEPNAGAGCP